MLGLFGFFFCKFGNFEILVGLILNEVKNFLIGKNYRIYKFLGEFILKVFKKLLKRGVSKESMFCFLLYLVDGGGAVDC